MKNNLTIDQFKGFAKEFAKNISKTSLVFLKAPMGGGKSLFCQKMIEEILHITDAKSPTYSYVNEYGGDIKIYHFDLYRIEDELSFYELGLEYNIENKNALRLVEWPDKFEKFLPKPDVVVEISIGDSEDLRNIKIIT